MNLSSLNCEAITNTLKSQSNQVSKSTLIAMLLVASVASVMGQATTCAAGGDAYDGSASFSYTIGQPVVRTVTLRVSNVERYSASLREGVQQTYRVDELKIDGMEALAVEVKIYPNPACDDLTVSQSSHERLPYLLFDCTGRLVGHGTLRKGENHLNLSDYAAGTYLLRLDDGSRANAYRITKR